jgi:hypothetical protein
MSEVSKTSFFSAATNALLSLVNRDEVIKSAPAIEGVQHRVAVLHVREGRIIEQSARLSGC